MNWIEEENPERLQSKCCTVYIMIIKWLWHKPQISLVYPRLMIVKVIQCRCFCRYLKGEGPSVVVSTAAFHARVRGSVPGLGGLKETKMFLPHPRVKVSIVGSLHDREVACSASDRLYANIYISLIMWTVNCISVEIVTIIADRLRIYLIIILLGMSAVILAFFHLPMHLNSQVNYDDQNIFITDVQYYYKLYAR